MAKKRALKRLLKGARGRVCSDEMETELSAVKQSSPSGGNRAQLITRLIALLPWSVVVAASCCGGPFSAEGTGSLVTMVGTMNETNFLRELVPKECQNHRWAATACVLTANSALELLHKQGCQGPVRNPIVDGIEIRWKFSMMTWQCDWALASHRETERIPKPWWFLYGVFSCISVP